MSVLQGRINQKQNFFDAKKRIFFNALFLDIKKFLKNEMALQNEQAFLWLPVFFALGIAAYFSLSFEPDLWAVFGSYAIVFCFCVFSIFYFKSYVCRKILIIFLMISSGFFAGAVRTALVHTPMLGKALGPVQIEGRIVQIEALDGSDDRRLLIGNLRIEDLAESDTPRMVRLRFRQDTEIDVGQHVSALARLMPLSSPVIPGGFDFQRYFYFQGIGAVGFIYKDLQILDQEPRGFFYDAFDMAGRVRQRISEKIYESLGPEQAAVAGALMIGERAGIAESDQEAMRASGLAHMLAISGLHVGLVSGVIFFVVRLGLVLFPNFALRYPVKKYAAGAAMLGAFVYMVLAGAPIPTQRAMLMSGVVLLAIMLDRDPFSLRLVAFAALVVLIFSPESLLSASFQMSFAAVGGLIWFFEETRGWWMAANRKGGFFQKLWLYLAGICATTVIAGLATAPFALYHFQQFANYSVFANLLAMPLLAFCVMPMAVVAALLMPLGLEGWPLALMGQGISLILQVAHYFSGLPGAVFLVAMPPFGAFIALVITGLCFLLLRGWSRCVAALPFVVALMGFAASHSPDILLSSNHKLMAYRQVDGAFYLSSLRREKFTAENWGRALGLEPGMGVDWRDDPALFCDDRGCFVDIKGARIAFSQRSAGQAQDCEQADLVIADDPVYGDCAAKVIDKFDSWAKGTHAVYLEGDGRMRIEHAAQYRNDRPWVIRP